MDYLSFLVLYILWILALLGFGSTFWSIFQRFVGVKNHILENHLYIIVFGILGMISVTTIATVINFFIPISMDVAKIIMSAGLILFMLNRKNILAGLSKSDQLMLWVLAGIIFLVIPLLWREYYDTGLYHLASVKWIVNAATPLGLANLHGRLGFNNSWFILAACIDQWVLYAGKPFFILNGIMTFFYGSAIFLAGKNNFFTKKHNIIGSKVNKSPGLADLFLFLSLIPWVGRSGFFLCSMYPDLPVMLLSLFVIYLLIHDLEKFNHLNTISVLVFIISIYAVTIKLSAAPLAFCGFIFLAARNFIERFRDRGPPDKRQTITANWRVPGITLAIMVTLILLPWLIRGILLSGCLAYPSQIGHFAGLQWAVSPHAAVYNSNCVTAWARKPGPDALSALYGWDWILPWFFGNIKHLGEVISLCIFGIAVFLYSTLRQKRVDYYQKDDPFTWAVPLLVSVSGLVFWFFAAPSPRFGYGYLYSFGLLICCFGLMQGPVISFLRVIRLRAAAAGVFALILIYGLVINAYLWISRPGGFNILSPYIVERKTAEGVSIYTPAEGDQVWNAPLPNTPYFNENLRVEFSKKTGMPQLFWLPPEYAEDKK